VGSFMNWARGYDDDVDLECVECGAMVASINMNSGRDGGWTCPACLMGDGHGDSFYSEAADDPCGPENDPDWCYQCGGQTWGRGGVDQEADNYYCEECSSDWGDVDDRDGSAVCDECDAVGEDRGQGVTLCDGCFVEGFDVDDEEDLPGEHSWDLDDVDVDEDDDGMSLLDQFMFGMEGGVSWVGCL